MLCVYAAIRRATSLKLRLIMLFGCQIVYIIVFFTNAIEFGTGVCFSCIVVAPVVISFVGDSMEHASYLLLECVYLVLEL